MKKVKIIFLVLPNVHLLDLAGPDQVFLEANDHDANLTIEHCSIAESVVSSSGVRISNLKQFHQIQISKGDYVLIPGVDLNYLNSTSIPFEKELAAWLKSGYEKGAHICSVCSGAFFLARLGLLNNIKCTTHWKRTKELKTKYPQALVQQDVLFTEDNRILTSAGVTAGIDLALHILSKIKDENTSFKVARELVVYMRRKGNDQQQSVYLQYRNHIHTGVHQVQDYVQENINKPISLTHLADVACTSPRNLTRIFKKETGVTVNYYITLVRKEVLKNLMASTTISRKEMASFCGLKSERHVIRLLK